MKIVDSALYEDVKAILTRCWLRPVEDGLPPFFAPVLAACEAGAYRSVYAAFVDEAGVWQFPEFQGEQESITVHLWMPKPDSVPLAGLPALREWLHQGNGALEEAVRRAQKAEAERDASNALLAAVYREVHEADASMKQTLKKLFAIETEWRARIAIQGKLIEQAIVNAQAQEGTIAEWQTRARAAESECDKWYGEAIAANARANRDWERANRAEALLAAVPLDEICAVVAGLDVGDGGLAKRTILAWRNKLIASEA